MTPVWATRFEERGDIAIRCADACWTARHQDGRRPHDDGCTNDDNIKVEQADEARAGRSRHNSTHLPYHDLHEITHACTSRAGALCRACAAATLGTGDGVVMSVRGASLRKGNFCRVSFGCKKNNTLGLCVVLVMANKRAVRPVTASLPRRSSSANNSGWPLGRRMGELVIVAGRVRDVCVCVLCAI
jgi:hypothetical protein